MVDDAYFPKHRNVALENSKFDSNKRIVYQSVYGRKKSVLDNSQPQKLHQSRINFQHYYSPPRNGDSKIKYIQNRFNPHANRPLAAETVDSFSASARPEETILVSQVLESPVNEQSNNEHPGYYQNPNYVTLSPVFFTTSIPTKTETVEKFAYYPVGAKFWILPVYVSIAFIAYYGYLLIRFLFRHKLHLAAFRNQDIDNVEMSILKIVSSIQKTADCCHD